jgi:NAD(P)-dependent dehydrogenase (short-subunit alcohol dehydrogenase family)
MKVFVVDSDVQGLRSLTRQLNTDPQNPCIWTAEVDVAEWESQLRAFETALGLLSGRIDYVFPIAGIGERRSFPNKPHSKEFEKPDISVIEVDEIGVIYTVSLAVQHFRRLEKNKHGVKGRSEELLKPDF